MVCPLHTGEGKDIELRHQRNPDVLFDSVRREEGVQQFTACFRMLFSLTPLYCSSCALYGASAARISDGLMSSAKMLALLCASTPSALDIFTTRQGYLCRASGGRARGSISCHRDAAAHWQGQVSGAVGAPEGFPPGVDRCGRDCSKRPMILALAVVELMSGQVDQ